MCGIAGQWGKQEPDFGAKALTALRHRGPDGQGLWRGEQACLVHTRLAILDLSEGGAQPMGLERPEGQARLVFNGEIYNYRELRAELETKGEEFYSESDSEVLLRLLWREGVKALPKLAGMFAFAYWREDQGYGLLARDALGIKPLYYRSDEDSLSFASEVRSLSQGREAEKKPDAYRDFLLWGSVPEATVWDGEIRELPSGHFLEWREGKIDQRAWHRLSWPSEAVLSNEDAIATTRQALRESIGRHLVSDVPVGIFLSGGLDSTAILALTRERLGPEADIRSFSIGFDDPAYDESSLARRTAEHFGAKHTEWRMSAEDGRKEIAAYLAAMDRPSIDGFNTWCVSKLAQREGMKVVLSGLGGDEVFAGYLSFERVPQFHRLHRLLGLSRPLVAGLVNRLRAAGSPWRRLAAFLRRPRTWLQAYHAQRGIFTEEEASAIAAKVVGTAVTRPVDWSLEDLPRDPRDVISHLELTRYMRCQLLRDSDVFSMAQGLELRVPFVDARLMECLAKIPASLRLQQGKKLLIAAVPEIPDWIREQPKRGFLFPFKDWLESDFGDRLREAEAISPLPLRTWYRRWALMALLHVVQREGQARL